MQILAGLSGHPWASRHDTLKGGAAFTLFVYPLLPPPWQCTLKLDRLCQ
jgi:hypothetical protein